jgi:hypothetical protein
VAIVYKAIRVSDLRRLPREVGALLIYMIGGLFLLGAILWLIQKLFI